MEACLQKEITNSKDNSNGCFDCNICLDNAYDPVVTLCGHLYCWPCIYKWLHFEQASFTHDDQQCPVCKADISQTTLVPLYGRGLSSQVERKDKTIPSRPPACGVITRSNPNAHRSNSEPRSPRYHGFSAPPTTVHPMIGMFGEMVYARVFGNSQAASLYWYPNAYQQMSNSPRARRQEMQAEKSLNRISIFLFCCFLFCLVLF
ncbi:RING-type E3 ubiquitin transferase [Ranunculus cassubicifolius]